MRPPFSWKRTFTRFERICDECRTTIPARTFCFARNDDREAEVSLTICASCEKDWREVHDIFGDKKTKDLPEWYAFGHLREAVQILAGFGSIDRRRRIFRRWCAIAPAERKQATSSHATQSMLSFTA